MNKRVRKSVGKSALTSKAASAARTPPASATPPATATPASAAKDGNGWALVPLEARSKDWLRGILAGRGVHFARRIVTEAGEDWRTFEETARAVLSGEIVPPTLAEVRAWFEREAGRFPSPEELERMAEPPEIEPSEPYPETWAKLDAAFFGFLVYGWFYQLAGGKGSKDADDAAIALIVEDAAPLFSNYCAEAVRDEIRYKAYKREFDRLLERRNKAKTKAEWKERDEELCDYSSQNNPYGFPGETLRDGLYSRAMDYLQRRLAALLPACDGRPVPLSPELAALREIQICSTALPAMLNERNRRAWLLQNAGGAAKQETRRNETESTALARALVEVQKRVDAGATDSNALGIVAQKFPVPSRRARGGFLSKEGLKGAWKKYKAAKRRRESEAMAGAGVSSPG